MNKIKNVRRLNSNKGITLIALVVTIIVLIILAGVTINLVIGDNGILMKAEEARVKSKIEQIEEKIKLAVMYSISNDAVSIDKIALENELKNNLGQDVVIEKNETDSELSWKITKEGFKFEITENGQIQYVGKEDKKVINNEGLIGQVSKIGTSGVQNIEINGVTYSVNVIIKQGDLLLDGSQIEQATLTQTEEVVNEQTITKSVYEFGNKETDVATASEDAKNMVILKVEGNLTINENVTMTACKSDNGYGGPKGLLVYCEGTITNNGTISMTARGARAQGENVYLWQNEDESYEYVPAVGAIGGEEYTNSSVERPATGRRGKDGNNRQTGGGGSGGSQHGDEAGYALVYKGGNGTSYSGGTGSGAINENSKQGPTVGRPASDNGGMRRSWKSI